MICKYTFLLVPSMTKVVVEQTKQLVLGNRLAHMLAQYTRNLVTSVKFLF